MQSHLYADQLTGQRAGRPRGSWPLGQLLLVGWALSCFVVLPLIALAQSGDRNNPTPLTRNELRGNIIPGGVEYYIFEAGPGDLTFDLEVKSNGDYSLVYVHLYDQGFQPLLEFDGSSSSDRRERKLILNQRQSLRLQISSPKITQGGIYRLKIGGAFKGYASSVARGDQSEVPSVTQSAKTVQTAPPSTLEVAKQPAAPASSSGTISVSEIKAERRLALVIGNSAYKTSPLRNPLNDARDVAQALRECGFEVTQLENLTRREMEEHIRAFGKRLTRDSAALFYYSGHGLQVKGINYLVPIDARIEKEQDVEFEAVDLGRVMGELEAAGSRLNIIILDACRDNPFARSFRSLQRGLAVVNAPSGSVIAYSTAPGAVADDGDARNGRYTEELLKYIREPGLKLEDVLKRVRIAVREKSQGRQIPWETSSIDGDFYFVRPVKEK